MGNAQTLEEVGVVFQVTRERIRQIEAKAMRKLRQPQRNFALREHAIGEDGILGMGGPLKGSIYLSR